MVLPLAYSLLACSCCFLLQKQRSTRLHSKQLNGLPRRPVFTLQPKKTNPVVSRPHSNPILSNNPIYSYQLYYHISPLLHFKEGLPRRSSNVEFINNLNYPVNDQFMVVHPGNNKQAQYDLKL
jgi:hypothetical protein